MPTKTIQAFDAVVTPAVGDFLLTQQLADAITRKLTVAQILDLLGTISQAEAEAGVATTRRIFTAERVAQALLAQLPTVSEADAEAGTATDRRVWTAERVAQAIAAQAPSVLARKTSNTSVGTTAAETSVFSATIPGGTLAADQALRVTLLMSYTNNNDAANTTTVRLKFGGTTFSAAVVQATVTSATARGCRALWEIHNRHATNAQDVSGRTTLTNPGVAGADSGVNQERVTFFVSGTVDTTADQTLEITVQHNASSASLSVTVLEVIVELV